MRDFQHGSHLLHQDLFRAETPDHTIYVGYDDVDLGVYMEVRFKHRDKTAMVQCGTAAVAIARACRFLEKHPVSEPRCDVDY